MIPDDVGNIRNKFELSCKFFWSEQILPVCRYDYRSVDSLTIIH